MFLPVDPAGEVFVVDRAVVDVDEGVDGAGTIPQARRVAAARVSDFIDWTKRDAGGLVQSHGEVDAETYGEGVGIVDPGRRLVAVLDTEVSPQPAKFAVGAVVGGAIDPGLTG